MPISGKIDNSPKSKKRILKWVLIFAGAVIVSYLGYNIAGERFLKRIAHQKIEKLTGLDIEIEQISFEFPANVTMKSLRGSCVDEAFSKMQTISASRLKASFSAMSIVSFSPRLNSLELDGFSFNLQRNSSGKWNIPLLISGKKKSNNHPPEITLLNGNINISQFDGENSRELASLPVRRFLFYQFGKPNSYNFIFDSAQNGFFSGTRCAGSILLEDEVKVRMSGNFFNTDLPIFGNQWRIMDMRLAMNLTSEIINVESLTANIGDETKVKFSGNFTYDKIRPLKNCELKISNAIFSNVPRESAFYYSPQLRELSGVQAQKIYDRYSPSGKCDLSFFFSTPETENIPGGWKCLIDWLDGEVAFYKFPYRLKKLRGEMYVDLKRVDIEKITASHGNNEMVISAHSVYKNKFPDDWFCDVNVSCLRGEIDDDIYKALLPAHKKVWLSFMPSGEVSLDFNFNHSPEKGKTFTVDIGLLGVDAAFAPFPYPLRETTGSLIISRGKVLIEDFHSISGDAELFAQGSIVRDGNIKYDIVINADNIPVDDTLRSCLENRFRNIYDQFSLENACGGAVVTLGNSISDKSKIDYEISVDLRSDKILYRDFTVPFNDVSAKLILGKEAAQLIAFNADFLGGNIVADGQIGYDRNSSYNVNFGAREIKKTSSIIDELPESVSASFENIKFQGDISAAGNFYRAPHGNTDYDISIAFDENSFSLGGVDFQELTGGITLTRGSLKLENASAIYKQENTGNNTIFSLSGEFLRDKTQIKKGRYDLNIKGLSLENELFSLFQGSKKLFDQVSPKGLVDLSLQNEMTRLDQGVRNDFNVAIEMDSVSLFDPKKLSNLAGTFKGAGRFLGGLEYLRGDLGLASIDFSGLECRGVQSELVYKKGMGLVTAEDIIGDIYGGHFSVAGRIVENENGNLVYSYKIDIDKVEIDKLLILGKENKLSGSEQVFGKVSGTYSGEGVFGEKETLRGRVDMDAENVSLKQGSLSANIVEEIVSKAMPMYTFESLDIDAYVFGSKIIVDDMYLLSEGISFRGGGEIDLLGESVNLKLTAHSGNLSKNPGMGESLANALGSILANISVKGKLSQPDVEVKMLGFIKGN